MTQPGIEPWSPGPLANTQTARSMDQSFFIFIASIILYLVVSKCVWLVRAASLWKGINFKLGT